MTDKEINVILKLFRKVIASLFCIKQYTKDAEIAKISNDILNNIVEQYKNYLKDTNVFNINFNYSQKDIVDFSNECYSQLEIFLFAEDLEYGFLELTDNILKGRENGKRN